MYTTVILLGVCEPEKCGCLQNVGITKNIWIFETQK